MLKQLFLLLLIVVLPDLSIHAAFGNNDCERLLTGPRRLSDRIIEEVGNFFDHSPHIRQSNYKDLAIVLNEPVLVELLQEILNDPIALERIARRSYAHALGFSKIILLEDWKTHFFESGVKNGKHGYDLRLHIWWPQTQTNRAIAIAEGRHEHRWDFTSRLITGGFENHRYKVLNLTPAQEAAFQKYNAALQGMSPDQARDLTNRIDWLEIADLDHISGMARLSGGAQKLRRQAKTAALRRALGLNPAEFDAIRNIYSKYGNEIRPFSGQEAYANAGTFHLALDNVETYAEGELYFHPVELAHRLFVKPDALVSTFILVSPPRPGHAPGQFARPSLGRTGEDAVETREFYTPSSLRQEIERYLAILASKKAGAAP